MSPGKQKRRPATEVKEVKQKYTCTYCYVNATSAVDLHEHVMGSKHRIRLSREFPQLVPHIRCFQNFVDVYLKEEPLLGLEYVVEFRGATYKATCQLCVMDFPSRHNLLTHLVSPIHLKKYLDKHHPAALDSRYNSLGQTAKVNAIKVTALKIQETFGRKRIRLVGEPSDPLPPKVPKSKDAKQSSGPPPTNVPNCTDTKQSSGPPPTKVPNYTDTRQSSGPPPTKVSRYTDTKPSSGPLPTKVPRYRDTKESSGPPPAKVPRYRDTKESSGQPSAKVPRYTDTRQYSVSPPAKVPRYKKSRQSSVSPPAKVPRYRDAKESSGSPPAKVSRYTDTKQSSDIHSSRDPASSRQSAPMANPLERMKAIQTDIYEKLSCLQFKHNVDFMNYLRNFEIQNDEDAKFMEEITKNCTKALMDLQEKQTKAKLTPSGSLHVSTQEKGTGQVLETIDKIDCCLSRCAAELSEETATPVSPAGETSATALFFSSIKNMEESEVVSVFEKIASTNPAFKGIDIPNVMKYLQENGRLRNT